MIIFWLSLPFWAYVAWIGHRATLGTLTFWGPVEKLP